MPATYSKWLTCSSKLILTPLSQSTSSRTTTNASHIETTHNTSDSWFAFFGDCHGGALALDDTRRFKDKYKWHQYNGCHHKHWVTPFSGERISLIVYKAPPHIGPEIRSPSPSPRSPRGRGHNKLSSPYAEHNIYTHFPKDPNCEVCKLCKTDRAHCRTKVKGAPDDVPEPKAFADAITADHKIINADDASKDNDRAALIVQDRWSSWVQGFACPTKSSEDTVKAIKRFLGPQTKCKYIYTDNSEELKAASRELGIDHDKSRPHRPQTNGVAERAVRRVKEGTSCTLVQSGWNEAYWPEAMNCFCFLRNAVDTLVDGQTAWEKRFGRPFKGKILPFGCEINYKPISDKDVSKTHQFGAKMLPGIFMGYKQKSGGGWTGDVFICDSAEIQNAQRFSEIYIKDFAAS